MQNKSIFARVFTGSMICILLLIFITGFVFAQDSLEIIVHYIEGAPNQQQIAYDTNVFLSVIDNEGTPIENLGLENFSITEDSKQISATSVQKIQDAPLSLIILIDSSGSMMGAKINDAKLAASNFIAELSPQDSVAILSFNQETKNISEYTNDLVAASDKLSEISAKQNTGTCLYDAAHQAAQMAATFPVGQRAIILLTDGVDELSDGSTCSFHTIDDVINLAASGNTRVPIYTIGLGNRIDEQNLRRISALTGGLYMFSPDSTSLFDLFVRLSSQLKSQYLLTYTSTGGPGAHTLIVEVRENNLSDQDSRNFLLPAQPVRISILTPTDGQEISGIIKIASSISGQGEIIDRVEFRLNDENIGQANQPPYEIEWDANNAPTGNNIISVIAIGSNGQELSKASATININLEEASATSEDEIQENTITTDQSSEKPITEETTFPLGLPANTIILIVMVFSVIVFILLIIIIMILRKNPRSSSQSEKQASIPLDYHITSSSPTETILGTLTINFSDDPIMVGQILNITNNITKIGRSAENDIVLPRDKPVSRHHAIIELKGPNMFLSEVASYDEDSGAAKRPTYGTFVNENRIDDSPTHIQSGDVIRLGPRTKLMFEQIKASDSSEEATIDELIITPAKADSKESDLSDQENIAQDAPSSLDAAKDNTLASQLVSPASSLEEFTLSDDDHEIDDPPEEHTLSDEDYDDEDEEEEIIPPPSVEQTISEADIQESKSETEESPEEYTLSDEDEYILNEQAEPEFTMSDEDFMEEDIKQAEPEFTMSDNDFMEEDIKQVEPPPSTATTSPLSGHDEKTIQIHKTSEDIAETEGRETKNTGHSDPTIQIQNLDKKIQKPSTPTEDKNDFDNPPHENISENKDIESTLSDEDFEDQDNSS